MASISVLPRTLWLVIFLAFAAAAPAAASEHDLYTATITVKDRSESSLNRGIVDALAAVVIRIAGERDAPQRLGPVLGNARSYVQSFGYLAPDRLQVGFDPRAVDRALTGAGLSIWGHERPVTQVWLQLQQGSGATYFVSDSAPSAELQGLQAVAELRGIPLVWPNASQTASMRTLLALQPTVQALDAERQRQGADALLIGYAASSGSAANIRWQLVFDGQVHDAAGSLESGVHLAADTFARMFATAGGRATEVLLEVNGISSLDAYAQTLNYLEGLTLVRSVGVIQVAGDTIQFRVISRGDASTLRRALALNDHLTPTELDQAAPDPHRLRMRLVATR